jgi:DNA-directed RNA polymerase specialized sigma24 family protein
MHVERRFERTSLPMHGVSNGDGDPSAELLRRWQEESDRDALDELLRIEIAILKSKLRRKSGSAAHPDASVSDLAQEAIVRLLGVEPAPQFENAKAMRAYLWTAAWRLLLERLRRSKAPMKRLDATQTGRFDDALATTGGIGSVEDRDRSVALDVAIQLLEPDEQTILALAYTRDLGIAGAARELPPHRIPSNGRRATRRSTGKASAWWFQMQICARKCTRMHRPTTGRRKMHAGVKGSASGEPRQLL